MHRLDERSWSKYRRKQIAELRPYVLGEDISHVSVSSEDLKAGSPKPGDMIARNPKNHADQWLVAKDYFHDNFSALEGQEPVAVKALEWKVVHDCAWFAFDTYRIEDNGPNWPYARYWLYAFEKRIGKLDSLDTAKAAAQADFERRIRSALAPAAPEPKQEEGER